MDKIIIEQIYTDHLSNKKSNKQYKNVVVEGCGPIGLYATIMLFIEGMNVTLIDESSAEYTRNHYIFVDRKWISELRYILGTGFDQLFVEDKSLLKDVNNDIGSLISYGMASEYYGGIPLTRTGKTYRTSNHGSIWYSNYASNTFVRIFEAKSKIQIEAKTPMAIVEFIEEIKNERKILDDEFKQKSNLSIRNEKLRKAEENHEKTMKQFDDFIVELQKRWFKALFNFVYTEIYDDNDKVELIIKSREKEVEGEASYENNQDQILYLDYSSTFWLETKQIENRVKEIKAIKGSAIIADISDLNPKAHFMAAIARLAAENAVYAIREYNESDEQINLSEALKTKFKGAEKNLLKEILKDPTLML
uniref:Uncharacterized protein n=1 Tax=Meloidogyne javanica TaxID=6303 RepID=A0A915LPR9_MELJA